MFFARTFLFSFSVLLITTVLGAPISAPSYSTNTLTTHPVHAGLDKRSPLLFSSDRVSVVTKRAAPEYSPLVARDEASILEARSFDEISESPLSKRSEEEPVMVRLVRRKSLAKKIREAFQKVGKKIKSGFQKAGKAIKKGFQKVGQKIKSGFQKAGKAIKKGFQKVGQKIKSGFQKAGKAIKKGFQKAGQAIKKGFQKAGKAIKKGFQKVGKFLKTTGAKIAKFGLKIYATATKIASKVANFIPGVGKGISKALDGVSRVANLASDKIHVSLGKKLDKGMKVMDRIQHPFKGAAGKVLDQIFKRDLDGEELYERELFDSEELYERDLFDGEELYERDIQENWD